MAIPSLADKVLAAANHLEAGGAETDAVVEDAPVVEDTPDTDDEPSGDDPAEEDELDELSLAEAKKLYKALKDPTQTVNVVTALAGQLGLLSGKEAPVTKTEVKEAKKDVKAILKDALGSEYSFLSDRIGNALDQIFEQERENQQQKINNLSDLQVERDSLAEMSALSRETKGESTKVEAQMVELAKKLLPGPGMTIKEYLHILYNQVTAGKQVGTIKRQVDDKIRRNANDVTSRLRTGGGHRDSGSFDPNKKYNLRESVSIAVKTLENQGNKK